VRPPPEGLHRWHPDPLPPAPRTSPLGGIANKIKVVKRIACSFRGDEHFFLKTRAAYTGNA